MLPRIVKRKISKAKRKEKKTYKSNNTDDQDYVSLSWKNRP